MKLYFLVVFVVLFSGMMLTLLQPLLEMHLEVCLVLSHNSRLLDCLVRRQVDLVHLVRREHPYSEQQAPRHLDRVTRLIRSV